jgi:AGZA family xanthine/uracil permease-like MFS transporter
MTVFGAAMYSYLAFVLLQRVFDQPVVGLVALAIVVTTVLAGVPITRFRIPPFLVAWIVPLMVGLSIGYVHPVWQGLVPALPWSIAPESLRGMLRAMQLALPYLSVIAPMAIYQVLQDIASVAGATAAGDDYDPRGVLAWDGLGTLACGLAGSVITPVIYAMHPPYKAIGARIGFALWTPLVFIAVVMSGLTLFVSQLYPGSIPNTSASYCSAL